MKPQITVKRTVVFSGKGIHSGEDVKVKVKNAPVDTGIIFIRADLEGRPSIPATVLNLAPYSGKLRCTSIEKNGASVNTIEHLMAALGSLGIDNVIVEVDNTELPALDGSALDYALGLQKAGVIEQEGTKKELVLREAVSCRNKDASITATPAQDFAVSYLLDYDSPEMAAQEADFSFDGPEKRKDIFIREIAPARTYCLESEVGEIINKGLGKGGSYKNALILRNGSPIENEFRFANEPARHKVMDLLGDLALINADIKAHVKGVASGHYLNRELLKKLQKLL